MKTASSSKPFNFDDLEEIEKFVDGRNLTMSVIGQKDQMPTNWKPKLPPKAKLTGLTLEDVRIVVAVNASSSCQEEKLSNYIVIQDHILKIKGKKKTEVYPPVNEAPTRHRDGVRLYRSILLRRDGLAPILLTAFDADGETLDRAIWGLALDVKTLLHNPKAPQPKRK